MSDHAENQGLETRMLGTDGPPVTRLGLGLAALGRPGYINLGHADDLVQGRDVPSMETQAHTVLDAAYAAGVRYFDAARSYGKAEAFLATWLISREIRPGEVTIGSKWGYVYTADWKIDADKHEIKYHTLDNLRTQREETEALLGPYLNLYQIHSATLESGVLTNQPILDELARLRDEGMRVGLSLSGAAQPETLRAAMAVKIGGRRLFDCVQATWNLLETSAGDALREAHAAGMGVIIKEGLANGRLTSRNDDPSFAEKRVLLAREAQQLGTTLDALSLAAVLANPWVDVVLSGAATVEQLQSNLASANLKLDAAMLERLQTLVEPPDQYWAKRASLPWN